MYKAMYYHLFNSITDAINASKEENIKELLKKAQIETEEMFTNYESEIIKSLPLD